MLQKDSVKSHGRGNLLHRVRLHAPPGVRLPTALQALRRDGPTGRQRPVGQHHGRHGPIRRTVGGDAYDVTGPLVTTASGTKFGKTESGAVFGSTRKDITVPVLSVLDQRRRRRGGKPLRRRRTLPRARGDRRAPGDRPGRARARPASARARRHHARTWRESRGSSTHEVSGAAIWPRRSIAPVVASARGLCVSKSRSRRLRPDGHCST